MMDRAHYTLLKREFGRWDWKASVSGLSMIVGAIAVEGLLIGVRQQIVSNLWFTPYAYFLFRYLLLEFFFVWMATDHALHRVRDIMEEDRWLDWRLAGIGGASVRHSHMARSMPAFLVAISVTVFSDLLFPWPVDEVPEKLLGLAVFYTALANLQVFEMASVVGFSAGWQMRGYGGAAFIIAIFRTIILSLIGFLGTIGALMTVREYAQDGEWQAEYIIPIFMGLFFLLRHMIWRSRRRECDARFDALEEGAQRSPVEMGAN